jgi:hypothetical protein
LRLGVVYLPRSPDKFGLLGCGSHDEPGVHSAAMPADPGTGLQMFTRG